MSGKIRLSRNYALIKSNETFYNIGNLNITLKNCFPAFKTGTRIENCKGSQRWYFVTSQMNWVSIEQIMKELHTLDV